MLKESPDSFGVPGCHHVLQEMTGSYAKDQQEVTVIEGDLELCAHTDRGEQSDSVLDLLDLLRPVIKDRDVDRFAVIDVLQVDVRDQHWAAAEGR